MDKEKLSEDIQTFLNTFLKVHEEKGKENHSNDLALLLSKTKPFSTKLYNCRKTFQKSPEGKYIYKYIKPEYAEQTLTDRYLYFSDPRRFEDLEDCIFREISMPKACYSNNGKQNGDYYMYKERAKYLLSSLEGKVSDQKILIEQIRSMIESENLSEDAAYARLNAFLDYVGETCGPTRDNLMSISQKLKVCCMTDKYDDGWMWEKYAGESKGICLILDWRELERRSLRPYRVVYGGNYDFNFSPEKWTAKLFRNCTDEKVESAYDYLSAYTYFSIYHKRARYRNESEWRLVGVNEQVPAEDAIAGVQFGPNISKELRKSITNIAKDNDIKIINR